MTWGKEMDNPLATVLLEKYDGDAAAAARYAESQANSRPGIAADLYLDAALRLRIRADGNGYWHTARNGPAGRIDRSARPRRGMKTPKG